MISADQITFDGDTLWWAWTPTFFATYQITTPWTLQMYDRPCATCSGQTRYENDGYVCSARCIDGRHTFEIEVNTGVREWGFDKIKTYRVSIVPGMVLSIVANIGPVPDERHIRVTGAGIAWLAEPIDGGWKHTEIILPPAAKVDGWAIKFNVQPKEQQ